MGGLSKIARAGLAMMSFGTSELVGLGKAIDPKDPKASVAAAAGLAEDKKSDAKKRKALYSTQGGVLGQEVQQVGKDSRGNIFGN